MTIVVISVNRMRCGLSNVGRGFCVVGVSDFSGGLGHGFCVVLRGKNRAGGARLFWRMICVWPEGGCYERIQATGANRVRDHDVCPN